MFSTLPITDMSFYSVLLKGLFVKFLPLIIYIRSLLKNKKQTAKASFQLLGFNTHINMYNKYVHIIQEVPTA